MYNLALYYVQNVEDAQEITQDVFVSVHQSLEGFKHESQISTWIHRITINKSLDFIKSRKRKKRWAQWVSLFHKDGNPIEFAVSPFEQLAQSMEMNESVALIMRGIDSLPSNQKTAIILSKLEDKKHQEIAVIMNISAKAVESLVLRAKKNLVIWLEANEGSE